jgi:hypothetical protein
MTLLLIWTLSFWIGLAAHAMILGRVHLAHTLLIFAFAPTVAVFASGWLALDWLEAHPGRLLWKKI